MSNIRFDNVDNFEDVVHIQGANTIASKAPAWEIPPQTQRKNKAIDNNIKLLSLNIARSAAALLNNTSVDK